MTMALYISIPRESERRECVCFCFSFENAEQSACHPVSSASFGLDAGNLFCPSTSTFHPASESEQKIKSAALS